MQSEPDSHRTGAFALRQIEYDIQETDSQTCGSVSFLNIVRNGRKYEETEDRQDVGELKETG